MIAADLVYRLKKEGNHVKYYIDFEGDVDSYSNMVERVFDWRKEIDWVTKDGLIIFDDVGYGKEQDELRKMGYSVVGGSEYGDKLEIDREYGQKIFEEHGIKSLKTFNFNNFRKAIDFMEKEKKPYVVKQSNHMSSFCFVGEIPDGSDCVELLKSYGSFSNIDFTVSIQERVQGVEVGVGRYFNGNDWHGPIEMNIEHKKFLNGEIGPMTAEMGTVVWYTEEENRLYQETLKKLKPYLKEINHIGDVDINCIVNESNVYPLEATMRFGSPAINAQIEMHNSRWTDFLKTMAKGEEFRLDYKKGFCIVVTIGVPPFPYNVDKFDGYLKDYPILFKEKLSEDEMNSIHWEEVYYDNKKDCYRIGGTEGYIMYITGMGSTIEEARKKVYNLINKIVIPKMIYRNDIGIKFEKEDYSLLKKWQWI